jgi:subtilase family serine protease
VYPDLTKEKNINLRGTCASGNGRGIEASQNALYVSMTFSISNKKTIYFSFFSFLFIYLFIHSFIYLFIFNTFYLVFSTFTFPMLSQCPPSHSPTHPLPLFGPGVPLYWGI